MPLPAAIPRPSWRWPRKTTSRSISVVRRANARYYVFVKTGVNLFERKEVTLSTETEEFIEIASGLVAGEEVVVMDVFNCICCFGRVSVF